MTLDAQPAGSSPAETPDAPVTNTAAEQAVASNDVAAFREARTAERLGKPLSPTAEIDTATPVDRAASTEVTPEAPSEGAKPRKTAEDRKAQLAAEVEAGLKRRAEIRDEIAREEARLAALRSPQEKRDDTPAPSPAPATFPSYETWQAAPENAEKDFADYVDARAEFRADQRWDARERERHAHEASERFTQSRQERFGQHIARVKATIDADPEFAAAISAEVDALEPLSAIRDAHGRWLTRPTGRHAIAEEIVTSEVGPQLMRHFSDHPDDLSRIAALPPLRIAKEIARLEDRLAGTSAKSGPAPKPVTSAPPPPTTLGSRASHETNAADAAVASGDVAAFRAQRDAERRATVLR